MTPKTSSGTELLLQPAEESCPYELWFSWLKNLAIACLTKAHLPLLKGKGKKHTAVDHWMVLILHVFLNLSIEDSADCFNEARWNETWRHQRRKTGPKRFAGVVPRGSRLAPHGSQVRTYRNSLPNYLLKSLNRFIFECQLEYAVEHKLISNTLDVLIDNTDQWYYGGDRYPENPFITGELAPVRVAAGNTRPSW